MAERFCVLCTDNSSSKDGDVRQLDTENWTKVTLAAERRLQRPNARQSKYWAVCTRLPNKL